jgi:hypothetical protein
LELQLGHNLIGAFLDPRPLSYTLHQTYSPHSYHLLQVTTLAPIKLLPLLPGLLEDPLGEFLGIVLAD